MKDVQETSTAGYTRVYEQAASKGTAFIEDAKTGVKTNHADKNHYKNDPTKLFRERIATNLVRKILEFRTQQHSESNSVRCLDVGCSTGYDLALLKETLSRSKDDSLVLEPIGLDLLGAQLEHARKNIPEGTFVEGNIVSLPFDDNSMDSVQCSRLLIHVPDLNKGLEELVRVLKPGGSGVVAEGNFYGTVVYTSDERLKGVAIAINDHHLSQCAHPGAAMDAYRALVANTMVENTAIEPFPVLTPDPSYGLGMAYLKPTLEAVVASGGIDQTDMAYFLETLPNAQAKGDFFLASMMFEVTFDKKTID